MPRQQDPRGANPSKIRGMVSAASKNSEANKGTIGSSSPTIFSCYEHDCKVRLRPGEASHTLEHTNGARTMPSVKLKLPQNNKKSRNQGPISLIQELKTHQQALSQGLQLASKT